MPNIKPVVKPIVDAVENVAKKAAPRAGSLLSNKLTQEELQHLATKLGSLKKAEAFVAANSDKLDKIKSSIQKNLKATTFNKEQQEVAQDILNMNPSLKKDVLSSSSQKMSPEQLSASIEETNKLRNPDLYKKAEESKAISQNTQDILKGGTEDISDFVSPVLPKSQVLPKKVEAPLSPSPMFDESGKFLPNNLMFPQVPKKALGVGAGVLGAGTLASMLSRQPQQSEPPQMGMGESLGVRSGDDMQQEVQPEPSMEPIPQQEMSREPQQPEQPPQVSEGQALANLLSKVSDKDSFNDALKRRDFNTLINQLGQAGELLGSSIAGTKPVADKLFQKNIELAQQIPEDYKQKIGMEAYDANSDISKNYREFLKRYMDVVPENLTAAQIKEAILPTVQTEVKNKAATEKSQALQDYRKDRLEQAKISLAKRQLESLKTRVSDRMGGVAGNTLRNRVQSADAIYGTVGIPIENMELDVDKLSDVDLNKLPPQMVAELAVEANRLLTGTGVPAQSTFQKLMPKNARMSEATIRNWVTSEMGPANQASFVKLILKTASRIKRNSQKTLANMTKTAFAGTEHIRSQLPEDYDSVIRSLNLNPEDFGTAKPVSKPEAHKSTEHYPGQVLEIKGKRYKVGDDGDSLIPL